MQTTESAAGQKEKEFKTENMAWTRIYYGREVMERIPETIDIKRALQLLSPHETTHFFLALVQVRVNPVASGKL